MTVVALFCCVSGCGESTQDAMYRRARQRAEAREAEEAAAAAVAAADAQQTAVAQEVVTAAEVTPAPPPAEQTAASTAASPAPTTPVPVPDQTPTNTPPIAATSPAVPTPLIQNSVAPVPQISPPTTVVELVKRNLWLESTGKLVASLMLDRSISITNAGTKQSLHRFAPLDADPTALHILNPKQIFVGMEQGSVNVVDLTTPDGIDEYAKRRMRGRHANISRRIHDGAVTAIAQCDTKAVSGDLRGELRIWSPNDLASSTVAPLTGLATRSEYLLAMRNDRTIFVVTEDGSVNYWQRSEDGNSVSAVRPYAKLSGKPIAISQHPGGKGLVVADRNGQISLSLPGATGVDTTTRQITTSEMIAIRFAENGNALAFATRDGAVVMQTLPLSKSLAAGQREIHRAVQGISSFDWAGDDQVFAYVSGKDVIELRGFASEELSKRISVPQSKLHHVRLHPNSQFVLAAGQGNSGEHFVGMWNVSDGNSILQIPLAQPARFLDISPDGKRFGVVTADDTLTVYSDRGLVIERFANCTSTFAFTSDSKQVLFSPTHFSAKLLPLMESVQHKLADAPVRRIHPIDSNSCLCVADRTAVVVGTQRSASTFGATFSGLTGQVEDVKISADGRLVAISERLTNGGQLSIWKVPANPLIAETIPPTRQIPTPQALTSLAFVAKSLVGGAMDGSIAAWDANLDRQYASLTGHTGPVRQLQSIADSQFLSLADDRTVRSWALPPPTSNVDEPVSPGQLLATVEFLESERSAVEISNTEDPLERVRDLLFGSGTSEDTQDKFFDAISGSVKNKELARSGWAELQRHRANLANGNADPLQLVTARQSYISARRALLPEADSRDSASLVDEHPNLLFSAATNFDFSLTTVEQPFRPVRLRLSGDRFIYAARTSMPSTHNEEGVQLSAGEDGFVMSWDFGYSGLQSHLWRVPNLQVAAVYSSPTNDGIFTVPNLALFANDGASKSILTDAVRWAVSPDSLSSKDRLLVIGKSGPTNREAAILEVYRATDLTKSAFAPTGSFTAFDGTVTAIAFANQRSRIAFAVRDRATTRVLVADPLAMNVSSIQLIFQHEHSSAYRVGAENSGPPGVTSLAFSPNDDVLVAHGQFENADNSKPENRVKGWLLDAAEEAKGKAPLAFEDYRGEGPLLSDNSTLSLRFLHGLDSRKIKSSNLTGAQSTRRSLADLSLVFEKDGMATVFNLAKSQVLASVPLTETQRSRAEFAITHDGRWMVVGDDKGFVKIWDLHTKKKYSLTLNERPAHTGPIVGVTIGETNNQLGYPEFAATAGEENQIKVWDLIPMLNPPAKKK